VFAEGVVYGGGEAGPEPEVVFGGEVGRVVWEVFGGWRCQEDLRRVGGKDGKEMGAYIRGEWEGWCECVVEG
jgi:hypothetical protein